jgi:hypothetical protein
MEVVGTMEVAKIGSDVVSVFVAMEVMSLLAVSGTFDVSSHGACAETVE